MIGFTLRAEGSCIFVPPCLLDLLYPFTSPFNILLGNNQSPIQLVFLFFFSSESTSRRTAGRWAGIHSLTIYFQCPRRVPRSRTSSLQILILLRYMGLLAGKLSGTTTVINMFRAPIIIPFSGGKGLWKALLMKTLLFTSWHFFWFPFFEE